MGSKCILVRTTSDICTWLQAQWPDMFYISSMHGLLDFDAASWTGINTNDNGFANTTKMGG